METAQMPFSDGGGPPAPMQTDLGVRGSGWANTSVQASSVPGSQVNERVPMKCDLVRMFHVGDVSLSYETNRSVSSWSPSGFSRLRLAS